ncbi:MAG: hypothetical protein AB7O37_06590 [Vicinamibacteria bacterium]
MSNSLKSLAALSLAAALPALAAEPSRELHVVAGSGVAGFRDGKGSQAQFNKPIRLAPFGPDAILVADIYNHALRVVSKDGSVRTLAGAADRKGHQDGPAAEARFASPHGVAVSTDGRIAVAEAEGHTLRLLVKDAAAAGGYLVSTLAGTPGQQGLREGPVAHSLFNSPHAVLWAEDGAVVATDIGNARLRRVKAGSVETIAGATKGDFVYPMDIAWAKDGAILVADAGSHLLRRVGKDGTLTTLTLDAPLATPHGVASGPDGTIYVADMKSHRILAIDARGHVTAVAGTGQAGAEPAALNRPAAVLVHAGWLWVADLDNHRISALPLE